MRIIASALSVFVLFFNSFGQNSIPNSGFEQWSSQLPVDWLNNSCPPCTPMFLTYVAQQDSVNPHSGSFSIQLIYNNTYATNNYHVPPWVQTTFPVQDHPVGLEAFVRSDIYGVDSVNIEVEILYAGNVVDSGIWRGYSSMNQWEQVIVPVTQSSAQVDSVRITLIGGTQLYDFDHLNDTKFWIDDLSLLYLASLDETELNSNKELVKIIDLTGRETQERPNAVLIYVYDDGSMEKVIKVE